MVHMKVAMPAQRTDAINIYSLTECSTTIDPRRKKSAKPKKIRENSQANLTFKKLDIFAVGYDIDIISNYSHNAQVPTTKLKAEITSES